MSTFITLAVAPVAASNAIPLASRIGAAMLAVAFGAFLIFGMGFAETSALHNAAHDGRHSAGFPCH
jgi:cobalt transporter subunit CbtB